MYLISITTLPLYQRYDEELRYHLARIEKLSKFFGCYEACVTATTAPEPSTPVLRASGETSTLVSTNVPSDPRLAGARKIKFWRYVIEFFCCFVFSCLNHLFSCAVFFIISFY